MFFLFDVIMYCTSLAFEKTLDNTGIKFSKVKLSMSFFAILWFFSKSKKMLRLRIHDKSYKTDSTGKELMAKKFPFFIKSSELIVFLL